MFSTPVVAWSFAVAAATVFFKVAAVHLEYFQLTKRLVRYQLAGEYVSVACALGALSQFYETGHRKLLMRQHESDQLFPLEGR